MAFSKWFERKPTKRSSAKYVYFFDEGSGKDQGVLGLKGAGLCELRRLGANVPPGFILSTELCQAFYQNDKLPFNVMEHCTDAISQLEKQTGRKFDVGAQADENTTDQPLLLSVRCAAPVDVSGVLPSILNVGMNDATVKILARESRNLRWAYDAYRRFLQLFSVNVLGIDKSLYDDVLRDARSRRGVSSNSMLNASDLVYVVEKFKTIADVPSDPWMQLTMVIDSMLKSWSCDTAERYRELYNISFNVGLAIVVQSMVFGNINLRSGVGCMTTRNPFTGEKELHGYCARISTGDESETDSDVRKPIADLAKEQSGVYQELSRLARKLETRFRDIQTVEYTIEDGNLYILEMRKAERTSVAAVRIAIALANERTVSEREALCSLDAKLIGQFVYPMLDPNFVASEQYSSSLIARGSPGHGGVVSGVAILSVQDAKKLKGSQEYILCVDELTWADEDIAKDASGLLIMKDGPCPYEMEIARKYNKSLVNGMIMPVSAGVGESFTREQSIMAIPEGETISIDGGTGSIYLGAVPTINPLFNRDFRSIMHWTERFKSSWVKGIAHSIQDVSKAVDLGAEGIGLFCIDELFSSGEAAYHFYNVLMSTDPYTKEQCMRGLEFLLKKKLHELYSIMQTKRVVLRMLDGPLSSLLPNPESEDFEKRIESIGDMVGISPEYVRQFIQQLPNVVPSMGCRGCRLAVTRLDLTKIFARAVTGAVTAATEDGLTVIPSIAIPGVCGVEEVEYLCRVFCQASKDFLEESGILTKINFAFGAVVETPRACLQAERLAKCGFVDFIWFDTNSLTELMFGTSPLDQHQFATMYRRKGITSSDPFQTIDADSVGRLLRAAVEKIRATKSGIKIGVIGAHCADKRSVGFFGQLGIDIYICNNLFHIPMVKLLTAQNNVDSSGQDNPQSLRRRRDCFELAMKKLFDWAKQSSKKYAYTFNDGWGEETELLGRKGAQLCEMYRLGLPIPQGFILSVEACRDFFLQDDLHLSQKMVDSIEKSVKVLESQTDRRLGSVRLDTADSVPLLLSVRVSCPATVTGLAPTILNLGLNSFLVHLLVGRNYNFRWVYESYLRFIISFGISALHIPKSKYDETIEAFCSERNVEDMFSLPEADMKELSSKLRSFTFIPEDPMQQLTMAIKEMFLSWNSMAAMSYRTVHGVAATCNLAVVVQSMVHGNLDEQSGAGIMCTRNPNTGQRELYGEFMQRGVGEDVVRAGENALKLEQLYKNFAPLYDKLVNITGFLERHYRAVQTVEFTIENNVLYILETQTARRSAPAAVKIAADMVSEGVITEREAILQLNGNQLTNFIFPAIDSHYVDSFSSSLMQSIICKGTGLGYGVISGRIMFNEQQAIENAKKGIPTVLCCESFSATTDLKELVNRFAIVVTQTKSSALETIKSKCQSYYIPICFGAGKFLELDTESKQMRTKDGRCRFFEGETITVDGSTGLVFQGQVPTIDPTHNEEFKMVLKWTEKYKQLQVLANADSVQQVRHALAVGAEGIGLYRTENSFKAPDRARLLRNLLLEKSTEARYDSMQRLLVMQEQDFLEIFRVMENQPITIRLLDGPLSEKEFCESCSTTQEGQNVPTATERPPAEGATSEHKHSQRAGRSFQTYRGARLAITHPNLLELQAKAILGALAAVMKENSEVVPDVTILVPFVFSEIEFDHCANIIVRVWTSISNSLSLNSVERPFKLGAMLSIPRACFIADKLASSRYADVLCVATDELTEHTFAVDQVSRWSFVPDYVSKNLLPNDPFCSLDSFGVRSLLRQVHRNARKANESIKLMVSNENGLDEWSVDFLERHHFDNLSCSAMQIPKLKVLSAQSHIRHVAEVRPLIFYPVPFI